MEQVLESLHEPPFNTSVCSQAWWWASGWLQNLQPCRKIIVEHGPKEDAARQPRKLKWLIWLPVGVFSAVTGSFIGRMGAFSPIRRGEFRNSAPAVITATTGASATQAFPYLSLSIGRAALRRHQRLSFTHPHQDKIKISLAPLDSALASLLSRMIIMDVRTVCRPIGCQMGYSLLTLCMT